MDEIQRPGALYQQVAAAIREAITSGEFPPGAPLPSEAQLISRYEVSRPTVRNAVAALRSEGLIEVIHGKGSFVRDTASPAVTLDRSVTLNSSGHFTTHPGSTWDPEQEPTTYRTKTIATTSALLQLPEGEPLFGCDRLLTNPATGTRLLHTALIPFSTAQDTPLADAPDTEPSAIYEVLTKSGHKLWWSETVRARMPLPDERTSLQLPDATPVIHTLRITHGTKDAPLILEELRTSGDRAQLSYRITADSRDASSAPSAPDSPRHEIPRLDKYSRCGDG
ncbi:GntR family transcriptional regulator [Streptomyces pathocidini]|uniref:GntR family transcriptional regulator n=1 Tax=Streptomyces pathocidini TaxID=1650571 RepID=A0ABW7UWG5_9ACTN|nr:GntR family transcriptional regulator [Streptomyces pathocidini]